MEHLISSQFKINYSLLQDIYVESNSMHRYIVDIYNIFYFFEQDLL